ncbi:MAG: TetR/AcrR family transcriptional regulator [Proteobacteria bacterium]|nr:TetR/AcrR family transcriptional regulator [Pseudomonadota bacterium]
MNAPAKPGIDGRRLRSERTRQLIIEAYIAIVRETGQAPTATQVAERAGYSVRSVFERFPDLEALRLAVVDVALSEGRSDAALQALDRDRATRLRLQVEARAQNRERWLPLWRVMVGQAEVSEGMVARIEKIREMSMQRIEAVFARELAAADEGERRMALVAIEALTEFESWDRLRFTFGLSFEEGCSCWLAAIDRLLPATPPASAVS